MYNCAHHKDWYISKHEHKNREIEREIGRYIFNKYRAILNKTNYVFDTFSQNRWNRFKHYPVLATIHTQPHELPKIQANDRAYIYTIAQLYITISLHSIWLFNPTTTVQSMPGKTTRKACKVITRFKANNTSHMLKIIWQNMTIFVFSYLFCSFHLIQ